MRIIGLFLVLTVSVFILPSCGEEGPDEGEDYGDILGSAEGLTLTEAEHEVGWGKSECTLCHQLENIHLENRTGLPIDIDLIHDEAIEDGNDGCADCHGANGVP